MKYDLVIFDMDGTTLFTLPDIEIALNRTLAAYGFPQKDSEAVRRGIGGGSARLIRVSVPEGTPEDIYQKVLRDFCAEYAAHVDEETRPYEGMTELLQALKNAGSHIATNSNKTDDSVKQLSRHHFGDLVEISVGEQPGMANKPDPEGVMRILNALNIPRERALYVGDGDADILTARNAGIDCAWVSWGYRKRDELAGLELPPYTFDTVEALGKFLLED